MSRLVTLADGQQIALDSLEIRYAPYAPYVNSYGAIKTVATVEQFSQKSGYDAQDPFWIICANNNGSVSFDANRSQRVLSVGTGATDRFCSQTMQAFVYLAGNIHRFTGGVGYYLEEGSVFDYGPFDDKNGFFYRIAKNSGQYTISTVRRTSANGSTIDTVVSQSNWNLDNFNGAGPSRKTLDLSKVQMLCIEWSWYGAGSVNFGFELNREIIFGHTQAAGNTLNEFILGNPDLPIRIDLYNTQGTTGNSFVRLGGIFLGIDGALEQRKGFNRGYLAAPRTTNLNTTIPLLAIRPATTWKGQVNRAYCRLEDFVLFGTSDGYYSILFNPTLTGGTWSDVGTAHSMMQYNSTATAASGGVPLYVGGLYSDRGAARKEALNTKDVLTAYSDGSGTNVLCIAFTSTTNGNTGAAFNWLEYY
jgi:hypothetical protein